VNSFWLRRVRIDALVAREAKANFAFAECCAGIILDARAHDRGGEQLGDFPMRRSGLDSDRGAARHRDGFCF